jgi:hypothetical protein
MSRATERRPFLQVSIPEASTWAMMLLGFAGLGFAGWRKAKNGQTALFADWIINRASKERPHP